MMIGCGGAWVLVWGAWGGSEAYLTDDGSDLRFKAHIQHPVSFVHNKVCTTLQVSLTWNKTILDHVKYENK